MAIFKCKMCGGALEVNENQTVCECEYCGSQQTLPKLSDDRKANLYDRANHFRRNNDFDKAMGIYEQILNEDNTDSEAYWSLVLCHYGIEYVEDPATHKRIPTVNRAQYTSIFDDDNYKSAIANADTLQRSVYEDEARIINEIQKGILEISQKEEPFDVFICYKETDNNGRRTQDSVLANDLYHQLTQEGLKVFFARITLEDKLGSAYEPYIFAALNSAKVMVVLGTKTEYFNAVWVKNEWSRYLSLVKNSNGKKLLIPAYRDMDPYDLPEEFSHLQAQDMSKLGFMQDLIRGIKKIIGSDQLQPATKETVVVQPSGGTGNSNALIMRGNMALEDGEWKKADEFFEEVLNQDAECAEAYFGKFLASYEYSDMDAFIDYYKTGFARADYEELEGCLEATSRIERAVAEYTIIDYLSGDEIRKQYIFDRTYASELSFRKLQKTKELYEVSNNKLLLRARQYGTEAFKQQIDKMLEEITSAFDSRIFIAEQNDNESIAAVRSSYEMHLSGADAKVQELYAKASERIETTYNSRVAQMNQAQTIADYGRIGSLFKGMHGYKDTLELSEKCQAEIERLKEEERQEAERRELARKKEEERLAKKKQKIAIITTVAIVACLVVYLAYLAVTRIVIPTNNYNAAVKLMNDEKYTEAIKAFKALNGYKDANSQIKVCNEKIKENEYNVALELMNSGEYKNAIKAFRALNGYKDANSKIKLCNIAASSVGDIVTFGNYNGNTEWIVLAKEDGKLLVISRYAIEEKAYNTERTSVTWESCELRNWLNGTYLDSAFSSIEQEMIVSTNVVNLGNVGYGTDGGDTTTDKVFLLSIDEVNKYFTSDRDRKTTLSDGTVVWWWLRSPGFDDDYAADVTNGGTVIEFGRLVRLETGAVRPAMWIDISNL